MVAFRHRRPSPTCRCNLITRERRVAPYHPQGLVARPPWPFTARNVVGERASRATPFQRLTCIHVTHYDLVRFPSLSLCLSPSPSRKFPETWDGWLTQSFIAKQSVERERERESSTKRDRMQCPETAPWSYTHFMPWSILQRWTKEYLTLSTNFVI